MGAGDGLGIIGAGAMAGSFLAATRFLALFTGFFFIAIFFAAGFLVLAVFFFATFLTAAARKRGLASPSRVSISSLIESSLIG